MLRFTRRARERRGRLDALYKDPFLVEEPVIDNLIKLKMARLLSVQVYALTDARTHVSTWTAAGMYRRNQILPIYMTADDGLHHPY